jgi:hypothetical protein
MTACNLSFGVQITDLAKAAVLPQQEETCLLPPFLSSQCCRALVGAGTQTVPRREICELCSFAGGLPFRRIGRICYGPQHLLNA